MHLIHSRSVMNVESLVHVAGIVIGVMSVTSNMSDMTVVSVVVTYLLWM